MIVMLVIIYTCISILIYFRPRGPKALKREAMQRFVTMARPLER